MKKVKLVLVGLTVWFAYEFYIAIERTTQIIQAGQ